jgi:hypothetical protein
MRERTFIRPSVQEVLNLNGIETPKRVTKTYLKKLLAEGQIVFAGPDSAEAIKTVQDHSNKPKIILFPREFERREDYANKRIKSLDGLMKIDSWPVLRKLSGQLKGGIHFGKEFARQHKIFPETLVEQALEFHNKKRAPLGFYWMGTDGAARATTWLRATTGAEMEVMRKAGDFSGEILDQKAYGSNLRAKVRSRTEEDRSYEFTLSRLPVTPSNSSSRFGSWINMAHNSNDPDSSYRGLEFDKRAKPTIFWSAPTIAGFYHSSTFLRSITRDKTITINPFPIPTPEMMAFIDDLRIKSLIITRDKEVRSLNKTEMDEIIGGKTNLNPYTQNWFHRGRRNINYLYTPE